MAPYMICFTLTIFIAMLNENLVKTKNKFGKYFTALLIVIIPAILAGCRDYSVGTDTMVYAKPAFETACVHNNYFNFVKAIRSSYMGTMENGFLGLAYFVSRLTYNPHWFLFAISFFINLFIYLSLYRLKDNCSIWIGETIYLFVCYNETYNMMRQCMALSVLIFAVSYLLEDKYYKYIIFVIIAYLFHRTAIIGLVFFPMYLLMKGQTASYLRNKDVSVLDDKKTKKHSEIGFWCRLFFISIGAVFVVISFETISRVLISIGILSSKYEHYVVSSQGGRLGIRPTFYYMIAYIFLFMRRNKIKNGYFLIAVALADIIFYPLKIYMQYLYRVSSYFMWIRIISLSQIRLNLNTLALFLREKVIKKEALIAVGIIICIVAYWMFFFNKGNYHETIPYTSSILGF